MKTTIISLLGLALLGILSSCTFVDNPGRSSYSRTTTSDVAPTTYGTVQTKTTQTY